MSLVYLIHFEAGLHVADNRYAQHYIGFVQNAHTLHNRMHCHRSGNGSRLMAAVTAAGIPWNIVRVWDDADRYFERKLKRTAKATVLCPVCASERGHRLRQTWPPNRPPRSTRRELEVMRAGLAWHRELARARMSLLALSAMALTDALVEA